MRARKQKVWEWPGVVNFTLGGAAAGYYLLSSLLAWLQGGLPGLAQPAGFKLIAPILTGLGFAALAAEAGHPRQARHLLRYLKSSWMSRETLAGAAFGLAAALDYFFPHPALWALAALGALGLLVSHGFIVYRARAMTAWNVPLMPLLFVTSGLATGSGLLLLATLDPSTFESGPAATALVCTALDLALWALYLRGSRDPDFRGATRSLRRPGALAVTVGIGHLLPILLLALLLLMQPIDSSAGIWSVVGALAGGSILLGGVSQKAGLILKADYLRPIKLKGLKSDASGTKPVFPLSLPPVQPRRRTE